MAEHYPSLTLTQTPTRPTTTTTTTTSASLHRKLQEQVSNSTQLFGLLTLLVTGAILLLLTGITVAATILGLIFFTPLIIVTSPIWVPAFAIFFLFTAGFLSMCGFGVVVVAVFSWMYRYFRGLRLAGSDRVYYARNRFNDIASHVIDYGGYMQRKAMDAAPGA
ncbi:oleosin-like [Gastrolobium bilobum]|uniref:oleosin-like n=1 Tax=Gastrolobium bilobum TaxID=150636 RepID=UPI002AAF5A0C|nr:oleosin-like [Gastrolobium bilobum]